MARDVQEITGAPDTLTRDWLRAETAWGVQARPGKRGLTLDDINIGPYGEAPPTVGRLTYRPRGAAARPDAPRLGYGVTSKADVWATNCAFLYEEAVQRQWSSATDIPWHELRPLPDDIERAVCQFCTYLTEVEFIAGDVPGKWVPRIPAEYMEAKLFLATQIM
ncbi:MAG: ferritin-like domain-containing protein, partial [Dehalococcoidia bacterium]|nr:ferritin-like domain-containing protein [Dehalococcoidia bacterium]